MSGGAIKIGTMLYHESRYWKTDNLSGDEVPGWNARYLPYVVVNITAARIYATGAGADMQTSHVQLPRQKRPKRPSRAPHETLEADSRQYHSRFHEYFYVEIPTKKAPRTYTAPRSDHARALSLLGIAPPYSSDDVNRAYKRLARERHPDAGGSHDEFIRLKDARDVALRGY